MKPPQKNEYFISSITTSQEQQKRKIKNFKKIIISDILDVHLIGFFMNYMDSNTYINNFGVKMF